MKNSPFAFLTRGGAVLSTVTALWMGMAASPAAAQPTATITFPDVSIIEGSGSAGQSVATFKVTLSGTTSQDVTLHAQSLSQDNSVGRTAEPNVDFDLLSQDIVFPAGTGTRSQFVTTNVTADVKDEPNEIFAVQLTRVSGPTVTISPTQSTANATIVDDDDPPALVVDGNNVVEGDTGVKQLAFTVRLTDPLDESLSLVASQDVTFNYATASKGNCVAGQDFVAVSSTGTIAAGQSEVTINVDVLADNVDELDEEFSLVVSNVKNATVRRDTGTGFITDDDAPAIRVTDASVTEGNRAAFTVRLVNPGTETSTTSPATVIVRVRTLPGQNTNDADIDTDFARVDTEIQITPGLSEATVFVDTVDDAIYEGGAAGVAEQFLFEVYGIDTGGVVLDRGTGIGRITDNDSKPYLTLNDTTGVSGDNIVTAVKEGNSGTTTQLAFTGTLSAASERPLFFSYRTETPNAPTGDVATPVADYTSKTGQVSVPTGQQDVSFSVTVIGDDLEENTESIQVRLYGATGVDFTPQRASEITTVGVIADDDGAQPVVNVTAPAPILEGNGDTPNKVVTFTIGLSKSVNFKVQVTYATQDGTAVAGEDYNGVNNTVTFNEGETLKQVQVVVRGDTLVEPNEFFSLVVSNAVNATLGNSSGELTITNDDADAVIESVSTVIDSEKTFTDDPSRRTPFTFTVRMNRATSVDRTFRWDVIPNANQTARTDSSDFITVDDPTVTIPAGQLTGTFNVLVFADKLDEENENFIVRLLNRTTGRILKQGFGQILDDDEGGKITIAPTTSTSNKAMEVTGATNQLSYTLTLVPTNAAAAGRPVVVNYTVNGSGTNPASPGPTGDIRPKGGSVSIPAGSTTASIVLTILDDTIPEEDEEVTISLSSGTQGWTIDDAERTEKGTIEDNDAGITGVNPDKGYANTNGINSLNGDGTKVVITGNNFKLGTTTQVTEVRFGIDNPAKPAGTPALFKVDSETQITANVPFGALSGYVRVTTFSNRTRSEEIFYVQPIVTEISPRTGVVPASTQVSLSGSYFLDPLNPIVDIKVGGVTVDPQQNGGSYQIIDANKISLVAPRDTAGTVPVVLVTENGGDGPNSRFSITFTGITNGGVNFTDPIVTLSVPENTSVDPLVNKDSVVISTYQVQLAPAKSSTNVDVAPRGTVTVRVTITDDLEARNLQNLRLRAPAIATPSGRATSVTGSSIDFTFPAGELPRYKVFLVDTGDDYVPPVFTPNAFFGQRGPDTKLTLKAEIIRSGDAIYPVGSTREVSFNRHDLHGIDLDAVGTTFTTSEDPNSPAYTSEFTLGLENLLAKHPDGDPNNEAHPEYDVIVPLRTSDPSEGLISWFVRKPGSSTLIPMQPIPQQTLQVRFSTDPNNNAYYGFEHVVRVTGVDDKLADDDVRYNVVIDGDQVISADNEYKFNITGGIVQIVNIDNEEGTDPTDPTQPGFVFSTPNANATATPAITVDEFSGSSYFRVRLRRQPTGKVTLRLRTSDPTEGLLIDPASGQLAETLDLTFTSGGTATTDDPKVTRYDTEQRIYVQGISDGVEDIAKTFLILTSTPDTLTEDTSYAQIDPVDVSVTNNDNSSYILEPSTGALISENGGVQEIGIRLSRQPTANVTVNFGTSDNSEARLRTNSSTLDNVALVFTPQNYGTAQTLRIVGVDDTIKDGLQVVTIGSTVISDDATFSGAAVIKPRITARVTDDETGGGETPTEGNTSIFQPRSRYAFSLPYMTTTDRAATATAEQLFNLPMAGNYTIYRYVPSKQDGKQLRANETVTFPGNNFVAVPEGYLFRRGIGYIIETKDKVVSIRTGSKVKLTPATRLAVQLTRNTAFTGAAEYNGLNLVGFPFDVTQYTAVDLSKCLFKLNASATQELDYEQAIGAGWISGDLYKALPDGTVEKLEADDRLIKPFGAYYVQIYVDNLTMIMANPNTN